MVGNRNFHGNQFYDKFGNPRKPAGAISSPVLTSAKLQPVAYENAEADDPLAGGGGAGDPLGGGGGGGGASGVGGGDPLDSVDSGV